MPACLQVRLLGSLEISWDGRSLPKPATLKSQSLLAYLIHHRKTPQPRNRLCNLYWGDRSTSKARGSLSTALWQIHRCLPEGEFFLTDIETIQFNPEVDVWLDVDEFVSCVSSEDVDSMSSGIDLYRGDFLNGFYDDWIVDERYHLESLYCSNLARLMASQESAGKYNQALMTAKRLLECDPLREDAHRLVMRANCHLGQRNVALTHYQTCRAAILAELDTEPMEETTDLYNAILDGRFKLAPVLDSQPEAIPPSIPSVSMARNPLDVTTSLHLVGRETEMAQLKQSWQEILSGHGKLLFVSGEAGVGKTRLVEELSNDLRSQGVRVLSGRCYEFERILPYQPIVETLRSSLPSLSTSEQALVPHGFLGDASEWSSEGQAGLFESMVNFLAGLSAQGPILIVLEDLHWAAESTLQMLHYLARHLVDHSIMLIGTVRSEEVTSGTLFLNFQQALQKEKLCASLLLSRLSASAVEKLILEMSGGEDSIVPLAQRLYRETDGNPFFLMETVKALFEAGTIQLEMGAWKLDSARVQREQFPLPENISATILSRVRTLNAQTQSALCAAAILGREFDFELLNQAWGRGNEATLEALDILLRSRLIEEGAGQSGRDYTFVHHKIQEAVYADIPRKQSQHGHARVAAAMEKLYAGRLENAAGEIAYHFEKCCDLGDAYRASAVKYLLQAGDRARLSFAFQDAADYYQRAVRLLKETHDYDAIARALMKLGLAHHNAFEFDQAQRAYEESFTATRKAMTVKPGNLPPAPHALRVLLTPSTLDSLDLDPINFSGGIDNSSLLSQLFSRLLELTPDNDIMPDVARSWQVLEDGCKYVVHLREDVFWSDGTPLTASDFEFSWKRMLDPVAGSMFSVVYLSDIKGVTAFQQGKDSLDEIGIHTLDAKTLVIELEQPLSYFLHLLARLPPVPRHVVEKFGSDWLKPENLVTYGPFRLEAWDRGKSLTFIRNPTYRGDISGNVERVEWIATHRPEDNLKMYEGGELDVMAFDGMVVDDVTPMRHYAGYAMMQDVMCRCVVFDPSRPPFDDKRVRQAFAHATDQEGLIKSLWRGFYLPATGGIIPPGMPGHTDGIVLPFDPPRARQLLAEAGYPDGLGFPFVDARTINWKGAAFVDNYLKEQWRTHLGIDIAWQYWEDYGCLPNLHRVGFDPECDPDVLFRGSVKFAFRTNSWGNALFDERVRLAHHCHDHTERLRLYRQAEEIMLDDAVIIPLFYHWPPYLIQPWVKNFTTSVTGDWYWKHVILEPH